MHAARSTAGNSPSEDGGDGDGPAAVGGRSSPECGTRPRRVHRAIARARSRLRGADGAGWRRGRHARLAAAGEQVGRWGSGSPDAAHRPVAKPGAAHERVDRHADRTAASRSPIRARRPRPPRRRRRPAATPRHRPSAATRPRTGPSRPAGPPRRLMASVPVSGSRNTTRLPRRGQRRTVGSTSSQSPGRTAGAIDPSATVTRHGPARRSRRPAVRAAPGTVRGSGSRGLSRGGRRRGSSRSRRSPSRPRRRRRSSRAASSRPRCRSRP